MGFGCDLAPSFEERERKDFKGRLTDHSGQDFQGDKDKLSLGELCCRREDEGVCGMQAEEMGYHRQ